MTRLQSLIVGGATAALVLGGTASKSFAVETIDFTNHLFAGSLGLPLGAAPPPGLYSGAEFLIVPNTGNNNNGNQGNARLGVAFTAVPLVWSTGWNVLGASYSMAVAQAFYTVTATPPGASTAVNLGASAAAPNNNSSSTFAVIANTAFTPIGLSWNLHNGFFVSAGFNFAAPDGTNVIGSPNPDYWTFEPTLAVSYIDKNWVLSANMFYDINTASQGRSLGEGLAVPAAADGYLSGEIFYADLTALYKFGKWELGPVAAIAIQTTQDQPGGGVTCTELAVVQRAEGQFGCGNVRAVSVGGLVGYDFGPVDMHVWAIEGLGCNGSVTMDSAGCGFAVYGSVAFRIWGPEAPKPLVAKN
jgi:hypothetical protein